MSRDPSCSGPGRERETAQRAVAGMLDAIRSVRLYGAHHAVTVQAVGRSHERFLDALEQGAIRLSVRHPGLLFNDQPLPSDDPSHGRILHSIAEAGIGELAFFPGLASSELESLYAILALPAEDIRLRGGINAVFDARCCPHLDARGRAASSSGASADPAAGQDSPLKGDARNADTMIVAEGFEFSAGAMERDPDALGAAVVQFVRSRGIKETYQAMAAGDLLVRAAHAIGRGGPGAGTLMSALGRAALAADGIFKGRLLKQLAREAERRESSAAGQEGLARLDAGGTIEALSAPRSAGNGDEVAGLLRSLAPALAGAGPERYPPVIVRGDTARVLTEQLSCSPEDLDRLQEAVAEAADTGSSATRDQRTAVLCGTLVDLARRDAGDEAVLLRLEAFVAQLEGVMAGCFAEKRFAAAAAIVSALSESAAHPPLRRRARQALRAACGRGAVDSMIRALEFAKEQDDDRRAIFEVLSRLGGEVTPALLELLAGEPERSLRMTLIRVLKELGRGQIALLGERLSDERWYFVRNIVSILGESRKEEAVRYLEAAAGHGNFQVRQEVVKALVTIGGRQAADVLVRFLKDRDIDIRFMAIRGIGAIGADGAEQERALIAFIRGTWLRRPDPELRREAVLALGTVGRSAAAAFLSGLAARRVGIGRKGEHGMIAAAARDSLAKIMGRQRSRV